MACLNKDGTLTSSAKKLLRFIQDEPKNAEELSLLLEIPLFKARSSLREMKSMGLLIEKDKQFLIHERALKLLDT